MPCPPFVFRSIVATGFQLPDPALLDRYRAAVADATGPPLDLKRVPSPYPQDHPRGDLLRLKTVMASKRLQRPPWLSTPGARTHILATWARADPVIEWFSAMRRPAPT